MENLLFILAALSINSYCYRKSNSNGLRKLIGYEIIDQIYYMFLIFLFLNILAVFVNLWLFSDFVVDTNNNIDRIFCLYPNIGSVNLGFLCSILILSCISYLLSNKHSNNYICILPLVLSSYLLFYSGSRGPIIITGLLSGIYIFIKYYKTQKTKYAISIFIFMMIFILSLILYSDQFISIFTRDQNINMETLSSSRLYIWDKVIQYLNNRDFIYDLFGNGAYISDAYFKENILGQGIHSVILRSLADLGIFGVCISTLLIFKSFEIGLKLISLSKYPASIESVGLILIVLSIMSITESFPFIWNVSIVQFLLVPIISLQSRREL